MEVRKGSMVNVNPTNTRPPNDTPEIRKYKKRFNSEILCAALWGKKKKSPAALVLYYGRILNHKRNISSCLEPAHCERCVRQLILHRSPFYPKLKMYPFSFVASHLNIE